MAFDKRGYYYRSVKVRGRVDREYFGNGEMAGIMATLDAQRREEREQARLAVKSEREVLKSLDRHLERLDILANAAIAVTLEEAGFHRHKGQWRKRRDTTINSAVKGPGPTLKSS